MQPKWITSMESFSTMILPVLQWVRPKTIAEIGAAEGGNTRILYEFLKETGGTLLTMDPFPRGSFVDWVNSTNGVVKHYKDYSLNCIPNLPKVDCWFVDGDHNWYTVFNELSHIHNAEKNHQQPAIIFMHDVTWPCGRRDMYYDPSQIPAPYIQPNSNQLGITLEKTATPTGGLKGPYWALNEGGPKNGVLTAVEDFLNAHPDEYHWICIPAILGLGVLINKEHPQAKLIAEFYEPYHNNPVMELVERDRIAHYLKAMALFNAHEKEPA
ncbi:MAG TPA: class I SAM-dependent methyltransferase [Gammaproteobacteria bacterium]|jgi:hypothetical protein|nr:class I SAM-dependent methyltransferase [Gammaproteobacteria bacterium]